MKENIDQKIEDAAKVIANKFPNLTGIDYAFALGVRSPVAREFNQKGMFSKEEVENILIEYTRSEFSRKSWPVKFFIEWLRQHEEKR